MNSGFFFHFRFSLNLFITFRLEVLNQEFKLKEYSRKIYKFFSMFFLITVILMGVNAAFALQHGNRGIKVVELQKKLHKIGYFDGQITGYYGNITQNAVSQFQANNGLTVDGIAGYKTLAALGLSEAITTQSSQYTSLLKLGSSGSLVIELQQHLQVMGYYDGLMTGYYDLSTQQAVILFQMDVGLKSDGIVGPLTQAAIESQFNSSPLPTLTSTPSSLPNRGDIR